ncbi:MAG: cyclase family protein [Gemmatimonadota bacterium]|nr:cyclase family protein [Gemmatimonadota bacterium]
MGLRDISIPLRVGAPHWPGDTPFSCGWSSSIATGASVNLSTLTTSPHVGTHADAPLHVLDGAAASHELPLDAFLGPAFVRTIASGEHEIELSALRLPVTPEPLVRLLLRTGHSIAAGTFPDGWPALSPDAARELTANGLRLLGVDAPSVDLRHSRTLEIHRALFGGSACVLENLDLRDVPDGPCELLALPLLAHGLDAAPVRALLRLP